MVEKCTTLKTEFPALFDRRCSVAYGDGWHSLVHMLCERLSRYDKQPVVITQIKEKFGGLRVYTGPRDEYVSGFIDATTAIASITCEVCTKPGKLRESAWIQTLCDDCAK